jgi:hypothetical protein
VTRSILSPEEGADLPVIALVDDNTQDPLQQRLIALSSPLAERLNLALESVGLEEIPVPTLVGENFNATMHPSWLWCQTWLPSKQLGCAVGLRDFDLYYLTHLFCGADAEIPTAEEIILEENNPATDAAETDELASETTDETVPEETSGEEDDEGKRKVTETEYRLLHRIMQAVTQVMSEYIEELDVTGWVRDIDVPAAQSFYALIFQLDRPGYRIPLQIRWPTNLVDSFVFKHNDEDEKGAILDRTELEKALEKVPVRLTVELAKMKVTLGDVEKLRLGEVIPIEMLAHPALGAGQYRHGEGLIFEDKGALVFKIQTP